MPGAPGATRAEPYSRQAAGHGQQPAPPHQLLERRHGDDEQRHVVVGSAQHHLHISGRGRAQRRLGEQHPAIGVRDEGGRTRVPVDADVRDHGGGSVGRPRMRTDPLQKNLVAGNPHHLAHAHGRGQLLACSGAGDTQQE